MTIANRGIRLMHEVVVAGAFTLRNDAFIVSSSCNHRKGICFVTEIWAKFGQKFTQLEQASELRGTSKRENAILLLH